MREQVERQLADWIDTQVIAEAICDHLEEQGREMTFENGKAIWLDALEHLHIPITGAIEYNPAFEREAERIE